MRAQAVALADAAGAQAASASAAATQKEVEEAEEAAEAAEAARERQPSPAESSLLSACRELQMAVRAEAGEAGTAGGKGAPKRKAAAAAAAAEEEEEEEVMEEVEGGEQQPPSRRPPPRPTAGGPTGAACPGEVTHGFTLKGAQLAWAVLTGAKRVENRHFHMQPGWYALHIGAATATLESQLPLIAGVPGMPSEAQLPHSAIVGAVRVSHALTREQCASTEPWAFGPVVNVIAEVIRLEHAVPCSGARSVWRITPEAVDEVRAQLRAAAVVPNDITHLPTVEEAEAAAAAAAAGKKADKAARRKANKKLKK